MLKQIFIVAIVLQNFLGFSQDSIRWIKKSELPLKQEAIWAVDDYNNAYIANKDLLEKYDIKGKKLFEQSLKRYGQISKIDARNVMKILLFSEQQQSVFYVDNTLTKQQNDIDLSEFDLSYVTQVSASNQLDKIWVYDQDNSKIKLITNKKAQSIQIENTAGIIEMRNISQFFEQNDRLFVVDKKKGIFIFDLYGTLIQFLPEENVNYVDVNLDYLYLLRENSLEILNLQSLAKRKSTVPISGIVNFKVNQNSFFCTANDTLYRFEIEIF